MLTLLKQKYKIIIPIIVLIILVIGLSLFVVNRRNNATTTIPETTEPRGEINYNPPTEQEKSAGDEIKQEIVKREEDQQQINQGTTGLRQVTPIITSASFSEVSAYVQGIVEEGGSCIATFTQGGTSIERIVVGFANVSYTQCAPISPELPNTNPWSVQVKYVSAVAEGNSETKEVR